jgi:hypothetical protein
MMRKQELLNLAGELGAVRFATFLDLYESLEEQPNLLEVESADSFEGLWLPDQSPYGEGRVKAVALKKRSCFQDANGNFDFNLVVKWAFNYFALYGCSEKKLRNALRCGYNDSVKLVREYRAQLQ